MDEKQIEVLLERAAKKGAREAWAAYRRALRDVTKQDGFPFNVTWPAAPM